MVGAGRSGVWARSSSIGSLVASVPSFLQAPSLWKQGYCLHCLDFGLLWGAQYKWWFGDVYLKALPWGPVRQMNGFLLAYGSDLAHLVHRGGQQVAERFQLSRPPFLQGYMSQQSALSLRNVNWRFLDNSCKKWISFLRRSKEVFTSKFTLFLDFGPSGSPVEHLSCRSRRDRSSREAHEVYCILPISQQAHWRPPKDPVA